MHANNESPPELLAKVERLRLALSEARRYVIPDRRRLALLELRLAAARRAHAAAVVRRLRDPIVTAA